MTTTKHIIMTRVRAIHALRPLVSNAALCVMLAVVSVYAVSREVWVDMVFRNMPDITNVSAVTNFFVHAFLHTGILVQAFSLVAVLATLFLIRESLKMLGTLVTVRT